MAYLGAFHELLAHVRPVSNKYSHVAYVVLLVFKRPLIRLRIVGLICAGCGEFPE